MTSSLIWKIHGPTRGYVFSEHMCLQHKWGWTLARLKPNYRHQGATVTKAGNGVLLIARIKIYSAQFWAVHLARYNLWDWSGLTKIRFASLWNVHNLFATWFEISANYLCVGLAESGCAGKRCLQPSSRKKNMTIDTDRSYQYFSGLIGRSKGGKDKQPGEGRWSAGECFCDVQIPEITWSCKRWLHVWKSPLSADQILGFS